MAIINLTNFNATSSQVEAGVENLPDNTELRELLTFNDIPTNDEIIDRAEKIADIAVGAGDYDQAMINGAPYLMSALETALENRGIEPVYSFSERVSVDKANPDGTVTKISMEPEHKGFITNGDISIKEGVEKTSGDNEGILNLTQHVASPDQIKDGVVEPSDKASIKEDLTFNGVATPDEIKEKAESIANKAVESGCEKAMIAGAPYLMSALETALSSRGIEPVYSYTERNVEKIENPDGSTSIKSTFAHKGFVEVEPKPFEKAEEDKVEKDESENPDTTDNVDSDTSLDDDPYVDMEKDNIEVDEGHEIEVDNDDNPDMETSDEDDIENMEEDIESEIEDMENDPYMEIDNEEFDDIENDDDNIDNENDYETEEDVIDVAFDVDTDNIEIDSDDVENDYDDVDDDWDKIE